MSIMRDGKGFEQVEIENLNLFSVTKFDRNDI